MKMTTSDVGRKIRDEMMWGVCNMHIHLCVSTRTSECPELQLLLSIFFCNSAKNVSGLDQDELFSNNLFDCFRTKVIKINCFRTGTMSATVAGLFAQGQFGQKIKREKT